MYLISFNPFPQTQSFDSSLNPYQQQQQQLQQQQHWPQATGMTNMTFGDPIGAGNPQLTVQNTGMINNPYQQQQQQLQLQNNPYQQMSGGAFAGGLQAQMTGLPQQSQMTGMAPFQTSTVTGFQQPQFTAASNNPFGQLSAPQTTQTSSAAFGSGTFGQTLSASPTVTSATLANRSPSLSVAHTVTTSSAAGQSRSLSFPSSPSMQVSKFLLFLVYFRASEIRYKRWSVRQKFIFSYFLLALLFTYLFAFLLFF